MTLDIGSVRTLAGGGDKNQSRECFNVNFTMIFTLIKKILI